MTTERPWYETLFERDWYDLLAPGGLRSPVGDPEYAERIAREAAFIAESLELTGNASILDLCCGGGRHTLQLAARGYRMAGLDLSPYHIELARRAAAEENLVVDWLEADMRQIPKPEGCFDAVINMFTAFGYFDDDDNQRVIEEVARVLKPGGRFLIDVINRDNLMRVFREADWSESDDGTLILENRRWDAESGRVHAAWTVIDPSGERKVLAHDERIYTRDELALRLAVAGLEPIAAFGGYDGGALTRTSSRLIVLAKKKT